MGRTSAAGLLIAALASGLTVGACRTKAAPAARFEPAPPRASVGPSAPDPCALLCRQTADLKCKQAGHCADSCREMLAIADCRPQMQAVLRCLAREPVAHWECNEAGEPAIKDGYCDAEQGGFVRCAERPSGPAQAPTPL